MQEKLSKIKREKMFYLSFKPVIDTMRRFLDYEPENIPKFVFDLKKQIEASDLALTMAHNRITEEERNDANELLQQLKEKLKQYEKMSPTGGKVFKKFDGINA